MAAGQNTEHADGTSEAVFGITGKEKTLATALDNAPATPTDLKALQAILTGAPPDQFEILAARELAHHLKLMCGVDLSINPGGLTTSPEVPAVLLIGRRAALAAGMISAAELEQVKYDGFVVRVHGGRVAIAGYRGRGTVYGAYRFLEKLGYRWYARDCQLVPKLAETVVAPFAIADRPFFDLRGLSDWQIGGSRAHPADIADVKPLEENAGAWMNHHTAGFLVPTRLYLAEHPEYYALGTDGKRGPKDPKVFGKPPEDVPAMAVMLCTSNPDVVRISTERTLQWLRSNPHARYFSISQGDSCDWCQCDKCRALDAEPGRYADRMLVWVNHIARAVKQEFPDKVLWTLAYCGSEMPPLRETPEENVRVFYCPYWGVALSMVHPLTHPANREAYLQFVGWREKAPGSLGIFDYNIGNVMSWDAVCEKIAWYARQGVRDIWLCGTPQCFSAMSIYLFGRLMWDPSLDPEALKREFVAAYYGPAAPHVLAYLDLVKARFAQGFPFGMHDTSMPAAYYDSASVARTMELFEAMKAAVKERPDLVARIETEFELWLSSYLNAVSLADERLPAIERECILGFIQKRLTKMLADEADLEQKAVKATDEKQKADLERKLAQARKAVRQILGSAAGLTVPREADPVAVAREFLADPRAAQAKYQHHEKPGATAPEKLPNGLRFSASCFSRGHSPFMQSWHCAPKLAMVIYTPKTPRSSRMRAEFEVEQAPAAGAVLKIEGQDSDKDLLPPARIRITVNGREIHKGDCGFIHRGWSWRDFDLAPGILKPGKNVLEIENIGESGRMDCYWFGLSEAQILWKQPPEKEVEVR